jgi:hypothetical protein
MQLHFSLVISEVMQIKISASLGSSEVWGSLARELRYFEQSTF